MFLFYNEITYTREIDILIFFFSFHQEILVKVELGMKKFPEALGNLGVSKLVSSEPAKEIGGVITFIHSMHQQTSISRCLMVLCTLNYRSYHLSNKTCGSGHCYLVIVHIGGLTRC